MGEGLRTAKLVTEIVALVGAGLWTIFTYPWFAHQVAIEQLRNQLEKKIKVEADLTVHNLGAIDRRQFAYDIFYHHEITNICAKKVSVAVSSLEWFTGEAPSVVPSFRANYPNKPGAIAWQSIGIEVHREPEFAARMLRGLLAPNANPRREVQVLNDSEGGIGPYGPQEKFTDVQAVHVTASPDQWVAFVLLVGLKTDDGLEQYYDYRYVHLATARKPAAEKPPPAQ